MAAQPPSAELAGPPAGRRVNVSVEPMKTLGPLTAALKRAKLLVNAGINATLNEAPRPFHDMDFNPRVSWTMEETKVHFDRWVLNNAFCDVVHAMISFLDEIDLSLQYIEPITRQRSGEALTSREMLEAGERNRKFHRLTLPDKLERIERTLGVGIDPTYRRSVTDVNALRNCLTHRNGRVAEKDTNGAASLVVNWRELELQARDADGNVSAIRESIVIGADGTIQLASVARTKEFHMGESVSLTAEEFAGLCNGVVLAGMWIADRANRAVAAAAGVAEGGS